MVIARRFVTRRTPVQLFILLGSMLYLCGSGLLSGCVSSSPLTPVRPKPPLAEPEEETPEVHPEDSSAVEKEAGVEVLVPLEVGRNPRWMKIDPSAVFPPPPPEGVETVAVPTLLTTPVATYRPAPLAPGQEAIRAFDMPTPKSVTRPEEGGLESVASAVHPSSAPSPLASAQIVGTEIPQPLAPALTSSFDTTTMGTNSANTGGFLFIPADPSGAAGPHHLVNVVNVSLRFHEKSGALLTDTTLASFLGPLGPVTFTFDPKVVYDQYSGRFVMVTLELTDDGAGGGAETSKLFVAVSDDHNPVGTWFGAVFDTKLNIGGTDHWLDYPGLAVDEEAVYVTGNMFEFLVNGRTFGGVRLFILDKGLGRGGFYEGGLVSGFVLDPYAGGGTPTTTQPAHVFGAAPPGVGTFLVSYSGLSNGASEFVQVVRVDDPLGSPTFTQQFIDVGNLEDLGAGLPLAPQSGTGVDVATNDRRALNAVWFEDSLWLGATIDPKNGDADAGEATAHWWEIDTSSLGTLTVADQGSVLGDDIATDTFTFFPAIAVNGKGQMGLGFSGSASSVFPGSFYTTRDPGDAAGSTSGSATLRAGTAFYDRFLCGPSNRWGDYSGIAVDPVDGCFWVYNKHSISRGFGVDCNGDFIADEDGVWGTAFGKICPSSACPADMVLADLTLVGSQTRSAASSILTTGDVTVPAGADVTFQALDRIVFESGFSVESGSSFTARTDAGCP